MTNKDNNFSLAEFLSANPGKNLGPTDYVHVQFLASNYHIDLAFCFIEFLAPKFRVVDGLIFLNETFDEDRYKEYVRTGKSTDEIQLWLNLHEITGIFNDIDEDDAMRMATKISEMWNMKIDSEFNGELGKARAMHDKELGEVYVTIDQNAYS